MQELQVQTTRSCIADGSCEAFSSESVDNKECKTYEIRSVFGQCDYFSGALIDMLCPYAVHHTVLIVFIDCFYSCWKETECASWGWGGPLEVCHQRPDVWWGREWGVRMDCVTARGVAVQSNRAEAQKVWKNCSSRHDPPWKLSPGPYWLWARKLHQDHKDITPSLKVRRPQITSHAPAALSCETTVSCSSCRKGVTLRNVFNFAWAKLQFPPRWARQRLFLFYFSF